MIGSVFDIERPAAKTFVSPNSRLAAIPPATVTVFFRKSRLQKAKKWLDEHEITYTDRHIVEQNPSYEELKEWHEKSGLPLKKFFNTSGLLYKEMKLKDRLPEMSGDEQLKLLATNGMLVKRPLIVDGSTVITGFKEKEWSEHFL